MKMLFIRHGKTEGNEKKRYIGITDEELSVKGREELLKTKERFLIKTDFRKAFSAPYIVVSPLRRCIQSAEILFEINDFKKELQKTNLGTAKVHIEQGLKECNFGIFENKNYEELQGEPLYQKWIDSGATMDFPQGECLKEWKMRCVQSFLYHVSLAEKTGCSSMIFVVHGGTIMAIMEALDSERKGYFDYHIENAASFVCEFNGKEIRNRRKVAEENE